MHLTRRRGLGALAVLCAPIPMPAKADMGHEGLAALVAEYEAAAARLRTFWDLGDYVTRPDFHATCSECGRLRAAIALHPVATLGDVMLKVRACAAHWPDLAEELAEMTEDIERNRGHGFDHDAARAVVIGLLQLREAGLCG